MGFASHPRDTHPYHCGDCQAFPLHGVALRHRGGPQRDSVVGVLPLATPPTAHGGRATDYLYDRDDGSTMANPDHGLHHRHRLDRSVAVRIHADAVGLRHLVVGA